MSERCEPTNASSSLLALSLVKDLAPTAQAINEDDDVSARQAAYIGNPVHPSLEGHFKVSWNVYTMLNKVTTNS